MTADVDVRTSLSTLHCGMSLVWNTSSQTYVTDTSPALSYCTFTLFAHIPSFRVLFLYKHADGRASHATRQRIGRQAATKA